MKKLCCALLILLGAIGCKKEKRLILTTTSLASDSLKNKTNAAIKKDTLKPILPIHGRINEKKTARYFPGVTDSIKKIVVLGSEKIAINIGNNVIVSMLHNTATFDEMILCTHDYNLNLLDHLYIGKATMFDITSHTIDYKIVNERALKFDHIDWGYIENLEALEIGKTNHKSYVINIDVNGKLTKSNTTIHKI